MLDRARVLQQLKHVSDVLFQDISPELTIAQESWARIVADPLFVYKIRQIQTPWLVPDWYEAIDTVVPLDMPLSPYTVIAVDGSQIYPDRHQGTSCFLVNIGSVVMRYNVPGLPAVSLQSQPTVFSGEQDTDMGINNAQELVNCLRQELEFSQGLALACSLSYEREHTIPFAFLFDGSLIFWHLESKEEPLKTLFLTKYRALLQQLYDASVLCAGYISLPKSKELVNLIRVELCKFKLDASHHVDQVRHVVDSTIASFFLKPYTRSTVFKSNAAIGAYYPDYLAPYFFYLDVGSEIVRVEIPAWIAHNQAQLTCVARIILDQAIKGRGYPVALAEAHEQAVVKGPDRDFFYHMVTKLGFENRRALVTSQKSMKKRGIGI